MPKAPRHALARVALLAVPEMPKDLCGDAMTYLDFACRRAREKQTIDTALWLEIHRPHGGKVHPIREEDAGHPSGTWVRRICVCGAKHIGLKGE